MPPPLSSHEVGIDGFLRLLIPHLYMKTDKNRLISDMNRECW